MQIIQKEDTSYELLIAIRSQSEKCDQYVLREPLFIELFDGRIVLVPAGFVTDCHSTPPWSQSLLPAYDSRTALAAIVHDYLYMHWEQTGLVGAGPFEYDWEPFEYNIRAYADECYYQLMKQFAPGAWRNKLYYVAVRLFGGWNWDKFRKQNA